MRIHEVLAHKPSHDVVTVKPDATVRELLGMLAEHNIGALVVSADGASVDGIVSERDVVRRLHGDESLLDAAVSTIMSADVHTCEKDATVNELMSVMTERRFRHIPVVEDGKLTGIVSIGDVVKSRMSELEFERDQLDHYVHTSQT
jgi:CBS domain-containing protein